MKHTVVFNKYNEIDIKPSELLQTYLRMTEKNVVDLLKTNTLHNSFCPACLSEVVASSFSKFNMKYQECANCGTLYVSPRPDDEMLRNYYLTAPARQFWREKLSKMTSKKRKEKVIKPRFEWIIQSTAEYLPEAEHILDLDTDQYGYIEEMSRSSVFSKKTLLNPLLPMKNIDCPLGITVLQTSHDEELPVETVDVLCLFEVADRTSDLDKLFGRARSMLKEGGLCFITGILVSGFDLQILWDRAENIFPPDRLNVLSIEGLRTLFKRHGFECLELSTPGIFDFEIVERAARQNPDITIPKFIRYIIQKRDIDTKKTFQEFLQTNLLSSYGRILLRKTLVRSRECPM